MEKPSKYRLEARRYGIAVAAAVAAVALKLALDPVADQDEVPFVLFPAAVMVAAWYGGTPAGIACTLLSAILSDLFFSTPRFTIYVESTSHRLNLVEFVVEGLIISLLAGALHRARATASTANTAAEQAQRSSQSAEARARQALADQAATNARFRRLVEANIIGVFVADASGTIYEANAAFLEMVGYSSDALRDGEANWRRMTAEEHTEADRAALEEIEQRGVCRPYEKELIRLDGTRVPVLVGAAVSESDDKMICFAADLSKQKEVEHELAAAKEAAETASRAKDKFVASISHDLRTPMNAILGMSDLALGENLPPLVRDYIETVKGAADTLLHLLNDLLDMSQYESGEFELERKPFNFRDTVDRAVRSVSLETSEKGLELACYIHSGVPANVVGDRRRVGQIVTNLVANAVKFTKQGEVVVSATVKLRDDESADIEIVV